MNNIQELKDLTQISDITQSLIFQELFESVKKHEEEQLPQGVWSSSDKLLAWDKIESKAWELLVNESRNFKLFIIWAKAYLKIFDFKKLQDILLVLQVIINSKEFMLANSDVKEASVVYMDKQLASYISQANLNIESDIKIKVDVFKNFNLANYETFDNILNKFSKETVAKLKDIYENSNFHLEIMNNQLKDLNISLFEKIKSLLHLISNFLEYKEKFEEKLKEKQNEKEKKETKVIDPPSENGNIKNVEYYKNAAYSSILDGVNILEKVDNQNILIPLLKKALRWKNMNLLEIFQELGDVSEVSAFMKMLQEKQNNSL